MNNNTCELLKHLSSYQSSGDWENCLYSCFYYLFSCQPNVQLLLPNNLISKNIYELLLRYQINYNDKGKDTLTYNQLQKLRSSLLKKHKLMIDGIYLLSALDGLVVARDNVKDKFILTSSCVYSINNIIRSIASAVWIDQFPLIYRKWVSGEDIPVSDFFLNKPECVEVIKVEWNSIVSWFLDNNVNGFLSKEFQSEMQNCFAKWKNIEFVLVTK